MAKLFNVEPIKENLDVSNKKISKEEFIEAKIENDDISDIIKIYDDCVNIATEGIVKAFNDLNILYEAKRSLESKKLSSKEYFICVENYSLYLKSVANNLGINIKIPSMEDFKNPYSIKASHEIIMENFKEVIKSVWEKIKKFLKDFFKKVLLFFKRLSNLDLQMEEYEEYIESLMYKVRNSNKSIVDSVKINSKLPLLLAMEDTNAMTPTYLMNKGKQRLINLLEFIQNFTNDLDKKFKPKFSNEINNIINTIKTKKTNLKEDEIDEIRERIADTFQLLFTNYIKFYDLPEKVQDKITDTFETSEIRKSSIYSAILDKKLNQKLPKSYNLYEFKCDFHISSKVNDEIFNSTKISILPHIKPNNSVPLNIETITNKDDLLALYDLYKDFKNKINYKDVEKIVESFYKEISKFTDSVFNSFSVAMEDNNDNDDPFGVTADEEDPVRKINEEMENLGASKNPKFGYKTSQENEENIEEKRKLIERLEELHKFIINYFNAIQVILKEVSITLLGLHKECKYELIKYLYKSAKQF